MADEEANLIIRLKDEATKGITSLKGSLDKLRAAWLGVAAAVAGAVAIGAKAIAAYAEEERELNKLNQALKNQGITSKLAAKEIAEYAAQIQKTTSFSDTAVIKQASLLTSFGLVGDQMKKASAAARDLSIGLGIDLNAATLLVGKAFTGETATLGRYGIKISETIPPAERFTAVMDTLNQRFGGQAEADLNTTTGRITALKNAFNDLQEKIGSELLPVLQSWVSWAEKAVEIADRLTGASQNQLSVTQIAIEQPTEERNQLQLTSQLKNYMSTQDQARIDMINRQLAVLGVQMEQENLASQQELLNQQATTAAEVLKNQQKEATAAANKKRFEQWKKDMTSEAAYNKKIQEQITTDEKKKTDMQIKMDELRAQNFASTLQFISSLATSENKTLAAIGKAAAIAMATIDTYRAANVALASSPPPFNFILAAAVVTAGLANVAKISGTKLAEGGVVLPRAGGIQATIGEGGQAEAVIPLGSDSARDQLQGAGLGETININVQIGTLVGSDGMREFAKVIDQELFSLRRNNESVAFEAV